MPKKSIWYQHPKLFELGMRLYHRDVLRQRYEYMAQLVKAMKQDQADSLLDLIVILLVALVLFSAFTFIRRQRKAA